MSETATGGVVDWQTLDPASITSVVDCRALVDSITKQMADIESQMDIADAKRELGEAVDPMWYARAKSALKYRGRVHQIISRRLGDLNRTSRQNGALRRWEYHRLTNWNPSKRDLDELGAEGWELVGFTRMAEFIFKRAVEGSDNG